MYLTGKDAYECDICGRQFPYIGKYTQYGEIWECEDCGKHFCTDCFVEAHSRGMFDAMLQNDSIVRCPDCFRELIHMDEVIYLNGCNDLKIPLLDRMRTDCEYFLGAGNRNPDKLWGKNVKTHVALMRMLWDSFEENERPKWMSQEMLDELIFKMTEEKKEEM